MATTPRSEDLIAEARAAVEGHAPTEAEVLAYRLADALEGQMQDREMLVMFLRNTEQQRAAALAVIEKARNVELDRDVPLYRAWPDRWDEAQRILSSVPADVLRERDAEKWDEGFAAGVNHDMGDWEVSPEPIDNPYRQTEEEK